jgi:hypothetical protein
MHRSSTRFVHARGRNHGRRLLDISDHVHEAIELGVHQGTTIALAIAQLHLSGNLCDADGLPGSTMEDLDLLTGDFGANVNAVLGVVSVEEIIHGLL